MFHLLSRRRAHGAGAAEPRYLFVVTYGRSGSTLTQGLLNALPGTLVRGENNMFLLPFYRAWAGLREFQEKNNENARRKGARSAFYGLDEVDPDEFVRSARDLALTSLYASAERSEVEVLGFKEVLWHRVTRTEVEEFFEWFERLFPGAQYVLNERDTTSVMASGFWRNHDQDHVARIIRRTEQIQDYLRTSRPGRTHDLRYESVTSEDADVSGAALRDLADFVVGRSDDEVLDQLRRTLRRGHGPRPFGASRTEAEVLTSSGHAGPVAERATSSVDAVETADAAVPAVD